MGSARSSVRDEGLEGSIVRPHPGQELAVCQGRRAPAAHRQPRLKSCGLEAIVSWRTSCSSAAAQYIVGQAGTAGNRVGPSMGTWQASSQSGSSGQGCSHSIHSVAEAAGAAPHRAWPWPLTPAPPHPVRPQPNWPEATVHPPSLFNNFARQKAVAEKRENSLLLFSRNRG